MSESIPFLGSKISLISKSEIRYEGILYTIDAQDSIIVLTKVQSFGTEDRPADLAVPAKNDVYEYIIFRGTDIKKIEVCDPPKHQISGLHNDPAIVSLQVQQQAAPSVPATSYSGSSFSHQPFGAVGSVGSYYGSYSQPLSQQSIPSSGFSIGVSQANILADVLTGSRSSTPSVSRKSPVADAGVQVTPPPQQQQGDKKRPIQSNQRQTPERQNRDGSNNVRRGQYHQGPGQFSQGARYNSQGYQGGNQSYQGGNQGYQGSNQGYQGGNQGYYQGQQYQGGQYRGGGPRGRAPRRMSQGGGQRGRGVFNQGNRQRQDQQIFEKEFDFEQANNEFEELRTQMANTKISENGTSPATATGTATAIATGPVAGVAGGEKVDEKKDDSGHETATTGDESEDSNSSVYYDKAKSFFDSISCEALERSKGKSQRSDWRQERKINVQTFGVATARRGYYPRGRGGYYNRGGYYRNYNNQNYNNQGYYNNRGNSSYRGSRGGTGGIGNGGTGSSNRFSNYNGAIGNGPGGGTTPGATGNSYASAVRSAVTTGPAK